MTDGPHFGLTGLAVMGANLARNVARHGIPVAVHNRTASKTERFMAEHGDEGPIIGTASIEEFVAALERPRTIMTMVKAGPPVDAVIDELVPSRQGRHDRRRRELAFPRHPAAWPDACRPRPALPGRRCLRGRGGCARRPEHHARR